VPTRAGASTQTLWCGGKGQDAGSQPQHPAASTIKATGITVTITITVTVTVTSGTHLRRRVADGRDELRRALDELDAHELRLLR
jgi:hypothetical protein